MDEPAFDPNMPALDPDADEPGSDDEEVEDVNY